MKQKEKLDAWHKCMSKRLYGAMVVMKILVFNSGLSCVKDVLFFASIFEEDK